MESVILTGCTAVVMGILAFFALRGRDMDTPVRALTWLNFVLSFAFGGFYSYLALLLTAFLLAVLWRTVRKNGELKLNLNLCTLALLLVVLGYFATPLWAADKGMAVFGIIRVVPIFLYVMVLMQIPGEGRMDVLELVPLSGAVMTLLSLGLQFIPLFTDAMRVNGRLAGFFAYPNTFAVFLLAGLLLGMLKKERAWKDYLMGGILVLGIIATGSRTAFIFLTVAVVFLLIPKGRGKMALFAAAAVAVSMGVSLLLSSFTGLSGADRFTTISLSQSTFLGRLLYYKDALGVILKNPFGTGYWGWRVLQGSIQTGRYSVSFVHNGLLQLLLDIGWIPALLLAFCFLKTIFCRKTPYTARAVLVVVLGHCLLDFDLQYMAIWLLLIPLLPTQSGKEAVLRKPRVPAAAVGSVLLALCLWLGTGDFLAQMGWADACLSVTPFRTDKLETRLYGQSDMTILEQTADRLLELCPTSSIAHSAKANAALSNGDILTMISEKELAISCARYSAGEYTDYLDKLFAVYNLFVQMGDDDSAGYCAQKILEVPAMVARVTASTSEIAYRTVDDPTLELPQQYLQAIGELQAMYE